MAPPKPLFDEEDDATQQAELRVNQEFAKRFEHNKKREELHRLQEKYPEQAARMAKKHAQLAVGAGGKGRPAAATAGGRVQEDEGEEESSSEDEEEDPEKVISTKTQAQIFETLLKIRARDQSIYQPDAKFYSSSSDSEDEEEGNEGKKQKRKQKKEKKDKPMYLKDVMYQQALQEGGTSSDEEGPAGGKAGPAVRTYAQEQEELKNAFLSAFEETEAAGGGGAGVESEGGEDAFESGVLKQRARKQKQKQQQKKQQEQEESDEGSEEEEGSEGEEQEEGEPRGGSGGAGAAEERVQQLLDGYFGRDDELSKEDRFLKRYILNKGWVEEGDEGFEEEEDGEDPHAHDEMVDDDEDFVEQAEQFEHAYNFRFEEPGAAHIVTYPRNIEGTVRKEDDRRKRKRQEKAERLAAEEEQRRAEVRRLKNLKKAEIEEKLGEIQTVAGKAAPKQELLDRLVAGDFDPEEYDRQMAAAFGDDYYGAEPDEEDDEDLADEAFERELEAMAKYGSEDEDPQSFVALHRRLAAQRKADASAGSEEEEDEEEEEGGEGEEGTPADREAAAKARAEVQRLLEEYFKLNYEDVVGGIPTRFRYKEVRPDTFGLGVEDILALDDKELNQIVGLKTLAPYREEYKRFRPNYSKINELRQQRQEEQQQQRGGGGRGDRHGGGGRGGGKPFGARQPWQQGQGQGQGDKWRQQQLRGGGGGGVGQRPHGNQPFKAAQQQQGHPQQQEREQRPEKSAAERRLESYDKPTLKKGKLQAQAQAQQAQQGKQGGQKRKREGGAGGGGAEQRQQKQHKEKQQQQQQQPASEGPQLSKAAKKNMKRAEKRAAKRTKVAGDGGGATAAQ